MDLAFVGDAGAGDRRRCAIDDRDAMSGACQRKGDTRALEAGAKDDHIFARLHRWLMSTCPVVGYCAGGLTTASRARTRPSMKSRSVDADRPVVFSRIPSVSNSDAREKADVESSARSLRYCSETAG